MKSTVLTSKRLSRNSGIELLKIFAIIMIVIGHTVQTISTKSSYVPFQEYVLNLSLSTHDLQIFTLSVFETFGVFGNTIFFVCSAYYLLDADKINKKKIYYMILEIWTISVVILVISLIFAGGIDTKTIIKCIFPSTFSNNWYLTCYMLFYAIHGYLNKIINSMNKIQLFRSSCVLGCIYIGMNYIKGGLFQYSELTLWIAIYFCMAYLKRYLPRMMNNTKINYLLLIIGVVGHVGIMGVTNVLGFYTSFFDGQLLHWKTNCSPFLIMISLSLLNIVRQLDFRSITINYISSLSLLVYIIHDNLILRTYYRPYMIYYVYTHYGYQYILLWVFILALIIFVFALGSSVLYNISLKKFVFIMSDKTYEIFRKAYLFFEGKYIERK